MPPRWFKNIKFGQDLTNVPFRDIVDDFKRNFAKNMEVTFESTGPIIEEVVSDEEVEVEPIQNELLSVQNEPESFHDEPEPDEDELVSMRDEPEPSEDELVSMRDEPQSVEQKPEQAEDGPESVHDEPETDEDELVSMRDEPQSVEQEPEQAEDDAEPVEQEPEPAGEEPGSVHDEPEQAEDGPESVHGEPEPAEEGPESVHDEPEPAEEGPESVHDEPEQAEDGPESVHGEPELAEEGPESVHDEPGQAEEGPKSVHGELEPAEDELVSMRDEPEPAEHEPEPAEDELVSMRDEPELVEEELLSVEDGPEPVRDVEPASKQDTIQKSKVVECLQPASAPGPCRRSSRQRRKPVNYARGERLVYNLNKSLVAYEEGFPEKYTYNRRKPVKQKKMAPPQGTRPVSPVALKVAKKGNYRFAFKQSATGLIEGSIVLGPRMSKPEAKTTPNQHYSFFVAKGQIVLKILSHKGSESLYVDENHQNWIDLPPGQRYSLKNCGLSEATIAYVVQE